MNQSTSDHRRPAIGPAATAGCCPMLVHPRLFANAFPNPQHHHQQHHHHQAPPTILPAAPAPQAASAPQQFLLSAAAAAAAAAATQTTTYSQPPLSDFIAAATAAATIAASVAVPHQQQQPPQPVVPSQQQLQPLATQNHISGSAPSNMANAQNISANSQLQQQPQLAVNRQTGGIAPPPPPQLAPPHINFNAPTLASHSLPMHLLSGRQPTPDCVTLASAASIAAAIASMNQQNSFHQLQQAHQQQQHQPQPTHRAPINQSQQANTNAALGVALQQNTNISTRTNINNPTPNTTNPTNMTTTAAPPAPPPTQASNQIIMNFTNFNAAISAAAVAVQPYLNPVSTASPSVAQVNNHIQQTMAFLTLIAHYVGEERLAAHLNQHPPNNYHHHHHPSQHHHPVHQGQHHHHVHHGHAGQNNGHDDTMLTISEAKPRGLSRSEIDSLILYIQNNEKDSRTCVICLSRFELKSKIRPLPCNHAFHAKCVDKWLRANRTCPICRRDALKTYSAKLKKI